jgi:uncharacterized damage-inducible protein DinB
MGDTKKTLKIPARTISTPLDLRARAIYPSVQGLEGFMKRFLVSCMVLLSTAAVGQAKSPVSDVLREMLAGREKNTVAAFEAMPAEKYGYKPTPEQITFGHLAAHIASSNYFFCSNAGDVARPKTDELKGTEAKEKLVAALKASFEFCHGALTKADDSKLNENITWFDGKPRPRAWAFMTLAASWSDHYGMAAMYLRQNGLLPPTAKPEEKK